MSKQFYGKPFSSVKLKEVPSFVIKEVFGNPKSFHKDRFVPFFKRFIQEKELINIHKQRLTIEQAQLVKFRPKGLHVFLGFIVFGALTSAYFHEKRHPLPLNPYRF